MKRGLILVLVFLAALALITVRKLTSRESGEQEQQAGAAEKQRVMDFWAVFNKASALRSQGNYVAAAAAYRESLARNPGHEDSLYYLATSLGEQGDYAEAEALFRKLTAANPGSARGFSQLANLLSLRAPGAPVNIAGAREAIRQSLQINREHAGPFLQLGVLELNLGRFAEAEENFRTAARFGSPEAKFLAGYTLLLESRPAEAAKLFQEVRNSYLADRKVVAKGVLSEGDVLPAEGKALTALERAGLRCLLFGYWAAIRMGQAPAQAAAQVHIRLPEAPEAPLQPVGVPGRVAGAALAGRGAWADFDRDGAADLVVAGGAGPLALYRNQRGELRDVTAAAGLSGIRGVWDVRWADVDRDGYADLYLLRPGYFGSGQNQLFRNNGNGTFTDITRQVGLQGERSTIQACFLDASGDGRPDLVEVGAAQPGRSTVRFFRNSGGRFVDETARAGLDATATAVDCAVADYDGDARPDLFVQFWRKPGVLYRNIGGKFEDATAAAGLNLPARETYSSIFLDYDKDGLPDLLVTAQAPPVDVARALLQPGAHPGPAIPRLFRNAGGGKYQEVTAALGLNRPYGTIQALAADLDHDGWPDLVLVNGGLDAQRVEPSVVLRNIEGKKFEEWSYVPGFNTPAGFLGAAAGDLNGDGFADLYFAPNPVLLVFSRGSLFLSRPRPRS